MPEPPDPRLFPYADHVLDRLDREREPAGRVRDAVEGGEPLLLDFHRHRSSESGEPEAAWCAAIRLERDGTDLVHLRGLVSERAGCAPMARVLAGLMEARYRLASRPRVVLDGAELYV